MDEDTHKKLSITDTLAIVGEFEHLRRHILRSVQYMDDDDSKLFWLVQANRLQEYRRDYMKRYFPVEEKFWCIVKSCATLRQELYETTTSNIDELKKYDSMIDEIMGEMMGQDLSGCEACKQDQEDVL